MNKIIKIKKRINKVFSNSFGLKNVLSTSLSDNLSYPNFCNKASIDYRVFSKFRRNEIYQEILEHVTFDFGFLYLNEINKKDKNILSFINEFKINDNWGSPELYDYPEIGKISPSTLRYIKVLSDLRGFYKTLDNLNICEIGVGYGGQCRIINSIFSPKSYTLVDIKPALRLSQTYLDNYILSSKIEYKTMNELEKHEYDLVISNYAFTELPRSIQDVYLNKVILNSKSGYITYNEITPEYFNSYKKEELLKIIPNSYIINEVPTTHDTNCIIVWGTSNQ